MWLFSSFVYLILGKYNLSIVFQIDPSPEAPGLLEKASNLEEIVQVIMQLIQAHKHVNGENWIFSGSVIYEHPICAIYRDFLNTILQSLSSPPSSFSPPSFSPAPYHDDAELRGRVRELEHTLQVFKFNCAEGDVYHFESLVEIRQDDDSQSLYSFHIRMARKLGL